LERALGEYLSEPKANVWFEAGQRRHSRAGVRLDSRTRMLYDAKHVFINGEAWQMAGADARFLRRLADEGCLSGRALRSAGTALTAALAQWTELGWLQEINDDHDT
jgi:50S ribosomal protein L16 3-hydroxylase